MNFDDLLIKEFENLDTSRFTALLTPPKIFLCGGPTRALVPESVRQRVIEHFLKKNVPVHDAIIQAENFNDYFKDAIYPDLLEFEADIANIATLIIICLESPGSFVELGMFCQDENLIDKTLVIAPREEIDKKESFIYHGPLAKMLRRDKKSVVVYPWADPEKQAYEHIEFIGDDILARLQQVQSTKKFDPDDTGHVALLIYDIIGITYPIKKEEIQLALLALEIHPSQRTLNKLLYLLEKVGLIKYTTYSSVDYYYDVGAFQRRIKFGVPNNGVVKDTPAMRMLFRQSYVLAGEESAKKRRYVAEIVQNIKAVK
jgi:hypothetical protein